MTQKHTPDYHALLQPIVEDVEAASESGDLQLLYERMSANAEDIRAALYVEAKPCAVCKVRAAVAGVYCQSCLDRETEGMGSDELF